MNAARRAVAGTSDGYSTVWLTDAAQATGGAVTSVEIDPARTATARATLERAGLAAELVTGDAGQTLRASADGVWDLVFLDAERPAYAGYWPDLLRTLRPGGGLRAGLGVPRPSAGYGVGMEKREHSVPDDAPGVEIPDDNDDDDLRDADGLEKLGESLPPDGDE